MLSEFLSVQDTYNDILIVSLALNRGSGYLFPFTSLELCLRHLLLLGLAVLELGFNLIQCLISLFISHQVLISFSPRWVLVICVLLLRRHLFFAFIFFIIVVILFASVFFSLFLLIVVILRSLRNYDLLHSAIYNSIRTNIVNYLVLRRLIGCCSFRLDQALKIWSL